MMCAAVGPAGGHAVALSLLNVSVAVVADVWLVWLKNCAVYVPAGCEVVVMLNGDAFSVDSEPPFVPVATGSASPENGLPGYSADCAEPVNDHVVFSTPAAWGVNCTQYVWPLPRAGTLSVSEHVCAAVGGAGIGSGTGVAPAGYCMYGVTHA